MMLFPEIQTMHPVHPELKKFEAEQRKPEVFKIFNLWISNLYL